ncbi:MAG: ABC transporter ATP-binding protein [Clostridiales bacterium]|nr:ABC transporter ATP-binding protein [Clostridiales bacterium]
MTIKIRKLSKSYGNNLVLDSLSFDIEKGKVTTLMGKSGCGKTTLAHILLGILKPDQGTIEGISTKSIAAVFQEDRLCEHLSALANIQFVLRNQKKPSEIVEHFRQVDLDEDILSKPVKNLSGGQRRRIAILRAIIADRDFICLDEPFKGLDRATKQKTMEYVKKYVEGKTVLFITHDEQEANFFGNIRSLT